MDVSQHKGLFYTRSSAFDFSCSHCPSLAEFWHVYAHTRQSLALRTHIDIIHSLDPEPDQALNIKQYQNVFTAMVSSQNL